MFLNRNTISWETDSVIKLHIQDKSILVDVTKVLVRKNVEDDWFPLNREGCHFHNKTDCEIERDGEFYKLTIPDSYILESKLSRIGSPRYSPIEPVSGSVMFVPGELVYMFFDNFKDAVFWVDKKHCRVLLNGDVVAYNPGIMDHSGVVSVDVRKGKVLITHGVFRKDIKYNDYLTADILQKLFKGQDTPVTRSICLHILDTIIPIEVADTCESIDRYVAEYFDMKTGKNTLRGRFSDFFSFMLVIFFGYGFDVTFSKNRQHINAIWIPAIRAYMPCSDDGRDLSITNEMIEKMKKTFNTVTYLRMKYGRELIHTSDSCVFCCENKDDCDNIFMW